MPSYQQPPPTLAAPTFDFDDQARPAVGGFDAGADEFGSACRAATAASADRRRPSTSRRRATPTRRTSPARPTTPTSTAGTATAFSRATDVTAITNRAADGGANVGRLRRGSTHTQFYLSFDGNVTIAVPGPDLSVADEDVVLYNAGTWSLSFDGSANGLSATGTRPRRDQHRRRHAVLLDRQHRSCRTARRRHAVTTRTSTAGTAAARTPAWSTPRPYGCRRPPTWTASSRVDATHFYLSFSDDDHDRAGHRRRSGRGRRLQQRRHLVGLLRRHGRTA